MKSDTTFTYVRMRDKKKFHTSKLVSFIILFIVCILILFPLFFMFFTSFKSDDELIANPGSFIPTMGFDPKYYVVFFRDAWNSIFHPELANQGWPVIRWLGNSLLLATGTTIWTLLVLTAAAYAFVFMDFKGKKFMFAFFVAWMAVPGVIGFAGAQSIRVTIGSWFNFDPAFIYCYTIFTSFGGVFNLLLMKSFLESVPKDLIESAKVEGASKIRIFWMIIVPLLRSTILLIGMWTFLGSWNMYESFKQSISMMGNFEQQVQWKTLTVGLTDWASNSAVSGGIGQMNQQMACAVISVIPAMIIYALFSNKMIDGIATSGLKR